MTFFFRNFNEGVEHLSPTQRRFITQIGLEPVLRRVAEERGARHLYGTELVGFEQDDEGVTSVIRSRNGDIEETVRSDYLVAADGAHSKVRELSGIELAGRGTFADCVTIYFRADMRELIGDRNLSVVYVNHPELLGFFRFSITGDSGFLAVFSTTEADGTRNTTWPPTWTPHARRRSSERPWVAPTFRWRSKACSVGVRRPPGLRASRTVGSSLPATRPTSCPRPAGSAATPASPTRTTWRGNSPWCWKARRGRRCSTPNDVERRSVSSLSVEQAYTRYVLRVDPSLPRDDMAAPLDDASIELGPIYRSAAVLDDWDDDVPVVDPRDPGGRPGTRAPHLAVELHGAPASIVDVFARGFVLLAGPAGQAWCDAAGRVAEDLDVPFVAHRVAADGSLVDRAQSFPKTFGTGDEGAVVVRPDGVVAWSSAASSANPRTDLEQNMHRVLFR